MPPYFQIIFKSYRGYFDGLLGNPVPPSSFLIYHHTLINGPHPYLQAYVFTGWLKKIIILYSPGSGLGRWPGWSNYGEFQVSCSVTLGEKRSWIFTITRTFTTSILWPWGSSWHHREYNGEWIINWVLDDIIASLHLLNLKSILLWTINYDSQ